MTVSEGSVSLDAMTTVKHQHYVPQFYLRAFSVGGQRKQVHVFDKATRTTSARSIKKVAQQDFYYDAPTIDNAVGQAQFLENTFGKLESRAAPLIATILESVSTSVAPVFTDEDLLAIVAFVAFQYVRTPEMRSKITQAWRIRADLLVKAHGEAVLAELPNLGPDGEAELHGTHLQSPELLLRIGASLVQRRLSVLVADDAGPVFVTSDQPVVYWPWVPQPGPHGIESLHVAVGIPLSPKVMLAFIPNDQGTPFGECSAVPITPSEVVFLNRMQVTSSMSKLFSSLPDFQLARDLLNRFPQLSDASRPRWKITSES